MSQNVCAFIGRLTDKPAGGQTNSQRSYARFSVAVQRNFKNQNGDYDADFINCTTFGHGADYLIQYAGQGDTVSVSGELRQNHWTDQQGNKRSDLQVVANQVSIIAHPQRNQVSRQHYESQQQSYQQGSQGYPQQQPQQAPQQAQQPQASNTPTEISDASLPFNHGSQANNSNMTNEDDLPF
jgi:single-strand DNA-binding protein